MLAVVRFRNESFRGVVEGVGEGPNRRVAGNRIADILDVVRALALASVRLYVEPMMRSMRYSGAPSTRSGGGGGCSRSSKVIGYSGSNRETWSMVNAIVLGRRRVNDMDDGCETMVARRWGGVQFSTR